MDRIAPSEKQYSQYFMFHVLSVIFANSVGECIKKFDICKVLCQSQLGERGRAKPVIFCGIEEFEMLDFPIFVGH